MQRSGKSTRPWWEMQVHKLGGGNGMAKVETEVGMPSTLQACGYGKWRTRWAEPPL